MKLKTWEIALIIALIVSFAAGVGDVSAAQHALENKLIRLHVVASSDSDADQQVKLQVRDAVLDALEEKLAAARDRDEAEMIVRGELFNLQAISRDVLKAAGHDGAVAVTLENETFPTRDYDGFSLPAGEYLSLRVTIGRGRGHNWWCVVFPPVCAASGQTLSFDELTDEEIAYITKNGRNYVVRFRIAEMLGQIRDIIEDII